MLRIRLRRVGRKNEPHYQLVVAPHTNAVKSSVTAKLGWYNPKTKQLSFDKEQLMKWLNEGAQPSNTVAKILIANKIEHKLVKFTPDAPGKPRKKSQTKAKSTQLAPKGDETAPETTDESVTDETAESNVTVTENTESAEAVTDTEATEPAAEDKDEKPEATKPSDAAVEEVK